DGAILRDLAQPGPVEVEVGDLPPGPGYHRLEPDAELIGELVGSTDPCRAGDPGDQHEPRHRGQVDVGELVPAVALPGVRQPGPGQGRRLVVQRGVVY